MNIYVYRPVLFPAGMPFLLPRSPISDSPFFFFTTFYLINLSFSSFFRHFRAFLFLTHNVLLSLIIVTTTYPSDFHSSVIDRLFLSSSISCILLHQLLYISSRQFSSPRQSSCRFTLLPVFFLFFLQEPAKFTFLFFPFIVPSSFLPLFSVASLSSSACRSRCSFVYRLPLASLVIIQHLSILPFFILPFCIYPVIISSPPPLFFCRLSASLLWLSSLSSVATLVLLSRFFLIYIFLPLSLSSSIAFRLFPFCSSSFPSYSTCLSSLFYFFLLAVRASV